MSRSRLSSLSLLGAAIVTAALLASCGGGGDGVGSGGTGILSGAVVKGPVANATVSAYALVNGQAGAAIGSAVTDANGNFTLPLGSYSGPLMLQASAGTYRDEASGALMTMPAGDVMTAVLDSVPSGQAIAGIQVTPVTAMAQARALQMEGGMTEANIRAANAALGSYFMVADILRVPPMNPLVAGSGAQARTDARNYGMTLAAMSQYAKARGMANTSAFVTSMMSDASDGMMNGRRGNAPVSMQMGGMGGNGAMAPNAGTGGLAAGMTEFAASPANRSGLTANDVAPLVQKLSTSNGQF